MTQVHATSRRPLVRNAGIDLLRGLAIVLVVIHHTALRLPLEKSALGGLLPERLLTGLQYNGFEAVFLFFVISGFLITSNSLGRWGSLAAIDAVAFWRRRAARILPGLLLLVTVLCVLAQAGVPHFTLEQPGQKLTRAAVAAVGLHLNWYEAATGYLPANWDVLWSLSIEESFYLLFPLLCLLAGRRTWLLVAGLALLALSIPAVRGAIHHDPIWAEKNTLQGMAAIATGVLAALLAARWPAPPRSVARGAAVLGAAGLLAVIFCGSELWGALHYGYLLVLTFSSAALVLAARWRQRRDAGASPARATAWLRSFGRLSYEVYLVHMFVVWAMVDAFHATGGDVATSFAWYLPVLALSWAAGWLAARVVTGPAERWLLRGRAPRAGTTREEVPA